MNESTTHRSDSERLNTVVQLLTEQGHQGFAEGIRLRYGSPPLRRRGVLPLRDISKILSISDLRKPRRSGNIST